MKRIIVAAAIAVAVFAGGFAISRLTASHPAAAVPKRPSPSLAQQIGQQVAKAMHQEQAASDCQYAPDGGTYDCGTP